jgi:type I restriction enzyme M protein
MNSHFAQWKNKNAAFLRGLEMGCQPREIIAALSEGLLAHYRVETHNYASLQDPYAIYQHLMDYWAQTMQDDCYLIAADGWKAETQRIIETDKKGKEKDKGWTCDLIPKPLIVARYYAKEYVETQNIASELETTTARLAELEEEEGAFADLEKINRANVMAALVETQNIASPQNQTHDYASVQTPYREWIKLNAEESELKKRLKDAEADLDAKAYAQYPKLTEAEIKTLVVEDKWLATLESAITAETQNIASRLTQRVKELSERYETPMPQLTKRVDELEEKVNQHLEKMGFSWK